MHTAQRLNFLGRIATDEQGQRHPAGKQAIWAGMLEADLRLQAVTIPKEIIGLSAEEYALFREGLEHIQKNDREALLKLRAIARKA